MEYRVHRRIGHGLEGPEAGVAGGRLDPDPQSRPPSERVREREDLQAHVGRPPGHERLGIAPEVRLVGPQGGRARSVELAVRSAQPAALDIGLLPIRADLGDGRLQIRVGRGRGEPQIQAGRARDDQVALQRRARVGLGSAGRHGCLPGELTE